MQDDSVADLPPIYTGEEFITLCFHVKHFKCYLRGTVYRWIRHLIQAKQDVIAHETFALHNEFIASVDCEARSKE